MTIPTTYDHPDAVERACAGTAVHRGVTHTCGPRLRATDGTPPTDLGEQVVLAIDTLDAVLNNIGSRLEPCAQ